MNKIINSEGSSRLTNDQSDTGLKGRGLVTLELELILHLGLHIPKRWI